VSRNIGLGWTRSELRDELETNSSETSQSKMSKNLTFLDCWIDIASRLFSQALVGEPALAESIPQPMREDSFGLAVTLDGEEKGKFSVLLDGGLAEATLLGEGVDQKAGWVELLKEVVDAAAGELLARTGRKCQGRDFTQITAQSKLSRAFQLKAGDRSWSIQISSDVGAARKNTDETSSARAGTTPALSPGLELLLDVELEASLRFGAREMPLAEILDLGPGDVVQLDRHIHDPVDLVVGDKIVARGEVVLVNGNFGLRVTEVAEPKRRLESIRCLF